MEVATESPRVAGKEASARRERLDIRAPLASHRAMPETVFQLPIGVDLLATGALALTGAFAALQRRYDAVGVFFLALVSGLGGGLLRDGLFIQDGPPAALRDPRYLGVVALATGLAVLLPRGFFRFFRFERLIALVDAVGLGAYSVYGTQKALAAGLSVPAALLVGVINATGGGMLRDVLTREEPLVFKPGEFYVLVAFFGALGFLALRAISLLPLEGAAWIAIAATFALRVASIRLGWRTAPFRAGDPPA